ncbi:MAG TPA: zinc metallopeptidase [Trueperaceae bacterium]|nr:zinc metallopeptidase [Trueperaceae bacterium]
MSPGYLFIVIASMALTGLASMWLRSTYAKWSKIANASNLTGAQTARLILDANGLEDVQVRAVPGQLSDHYNPADRTVNLSEGNYSHNTVAGMAVAAHEVGHAIQHAKAYTPLNIRSALVPVTNIGSRFGPLLIMAGLFIGFTGLTQIGIVLFSAAVLFQVVTLPVEFDASRRAAVQLNKLGVVTKQDSAGVKNVLTAAAMTYVAAAATSIMWLLYYISRSRR